MSINVKRDCSDLPINKSFCSSCPFRPNLKGQYTNMQLANTVILRNWSYQADQICHGTEGLNHEPKFKCKGVSDYFTEISGRLAKRRSV